MDVVKLDGAAIRAALWGTAAPVDPGTHELEATSPATRRWTGRVLVRPERDNANGRQALSKSSDLRLGLEPMPALECNAMSLGLGFTAQRAKLGAIVEAPPKKPDLCGDAGADAG
jgi:hypothetical protein